MAAGEVSESWARQLAAWDDRLPAGEIDKADKILLGAVRAGLDLHPDVARLAQAIYEAVRGRQPDADRPTTAMKTATCDIMRLDWRVRGAPPLPRAAGRPGLVAHVTIETFLVSGAPAPETKNVCLMAWLAGQT